MVVIPSFKTPAWRSLIASFVVAIALSVATMPASAKPSGPSSSTTASATLTPSIWFPDASCTFDVTYRWAGVKGRNLSAAVSLVDHTGATIASAPRVTNVSGSGKVELIVNFTGSVGDARNISTRGSLFSGSTEVGSSVATSQPLLSNCGGAYGIRSFTTIGLS